MKKTVILFLGILCSVGMCLADQTYHAIVPNINGTLYEAYYLYNSTADNTTGIITGYSNSKIVWNSGFQDWVSSTGISGVGTTSTSASGTGWQTINSNRINFNGTYFTFYVKNCTEVGIIGKSGGNSRYINISVKEKNSETELAGEVTACGNASNTITTYDAPLDPTKEYVIEVTHTGGGNGQFWQIHFKAPELTIAKEYGWASMFLPYPALVPANCTAYYPKSTDVSGSYVTLTAYSSGSTIPKNTGVVVKDNTWDGTSDHTFSFAYSSAASTAATNNMLSGTITEIDATEGDYVLSGDATDGTTPAQCVFAPYGGSKLAAYKAYIPAANAPAAPSIRFIIEEENGATNLGNIESTEEAVKFIQNGQLFIKKNGVVYDMMGHAIR